MPPGPRQRRATKIANRSKVTPFDRLAQWNAQIMNLGPQGAIPSIVGNSLEFIKLNASSIPGVMDNPATEDLIMGPWDILFDTGGNINMTNGMISGVQNLNSSGNLTLSAIQTNINGHIIDLSGDQVTIDAGNAGIIIGSDKQIYMDAVGGDIELNSSSKIKLDAVSFVELSGNQVCIDAGGGVGSGGVNIDSDAKITMDANDIELDATGTVDIKGGSSNLKLSGGATTLTSGNITVSSVSSLNLSCAGNGIDITGTNINIGTSSSAVDISGQITLNNVVDLKATDITATGTIQGGSLTDGVATLNIGALSGATTITSTGQIQGGSLTDGVATLNAGALSGATTITSTGQIQGGSLTDGTATLNNGSMTGLVDVSTNSITLINTKFTSTSETRDLSNAPYVWGVNYLEQKDSLDPFLVGSYKQIKSALFYWEGSELISFIPPNNVPPLPGTGIPVLTPPCQGGGELLQLGTPKIWDLPAANYNATYHTFTIPQVVERTMMTVELSIDIWYDSTGAARVNTIFFWLGKSASGTTDGGGSGPRAYRMATHMPSYFGTVAMEPTFCHSASITLLGGDAILPYHPDNPRFEFHAGDTFYLTAQCMGSPSFPRYKTLRVKVTWEALN